MHATYTNRIQQTIHHQQRLPILVYQLPITLRTDSSDNICEVLGFVCTEVQKWLLEPLANDGLPSLIVGSHCSSRLGSWSITNDIVGDFWLLDSPFWNAGVELE